MHNPMIGRVTSHYDMGRKHPVFHTVQPHRGIDLGAPLGVKPWDYIGAPIRASYAGVVEAVCSTWKTGWGAIWGRSGNGVFIRNPDGEGQYYGHLNRVYVKKGQRVTKGEIIGEMGVTGNVTGPHLHFETHNRGSGPANNYTRTRDPMVDFRAANITPGVDPIIFHNTPAQEDELSAEDVKNINDRIDKLTRAVEQLTGGNPVNLRDTTAWRVIDGQQKATSASRVLQEIHGLAAEGARAAGATEQALAAIFERPRENENIGDK